MPPQYLYMNRFSNIKACIFDLDGVIVDTAKYHYLAWRRLANSLGFDLTEHDNEQLKGVSRKESLEIILQMGGVQLDAATFQEAMDNKNAWYVAYIQQMTPDEILPGVVAFLSALQKRGIKIGLGSASKNAPMILERVGLMPFFDAVIDGNHTTKSKPDPEVFLLGAAALGVAPSECIVFEDAQTGIAAAKTGGFHAIGVGSPATLSAADMVIESFDGFSLA